MYCFSSRFFEGVEICQQTASLENALRQFLLLFDNYHGLIDIEFQHFLACYIEIAGENYLKSIM